MGSGERAWAGGGITFWVFLARPHAPPPITLSSPPAGKWSVASASVSRIQIGVTKAKSVSLLQSGEKHRFQKPIDRFFGIDADADGQSTLITKTRKFWARAHVTWFPLFSEEKGKMAEYLSGIILLLPIFSWGFCPHHPSFPSRGSPSFPLLVSNNPFFPILSFPNSDLVPIVASAFTEESLLPARYSFPEKNQKEKKYFFAFPFPRFPYEN